jgi:hypothetical protein
LATINTRSVKNIGSHVTIHLSGDLISCNWPGIPQYSAKDKMKRPLAIALAFLLVLCSLKAVETTTRGRHCKYISGECSHQLTCQCASFSSQTVTNTLEKKDSVYTLTVDISSILPSSLVIDSSLRPASFQINATPSSSSSSSSQAMGTALPILAAVAVPVAMILPRINA